MEIPVAFAGSPLCRASQERRDAAWLDAQLSAQETRFLPLWQLRPLVKRGEGHALAWARREFFDGLDPSPEPVLLGTEAGVAHYAVDVSHVERPEEAFGVADVAGFEDLRAAVPRLPGPHAAIAAQARSLVDWHARHRFCAACGGDTTAVAGGAHRRCIDCAAEHFPRTDPVAIALVTRGSRCLLGRSRGWPERLYSALAGFVEQGETLEEAVRREVLEESGVTVGPVRYQASQPWPFPSSLMLGCLAEAESEAIEIDGAELEDARWFEREQMRAALAGEAPGVAVPPSFSMAHCLIRTWIDGSD